MTSSPARMWPVASPASPPRKPPQAPKGLGAAGRRLWRQVVADFELGAGERELLEQACRVLDIIRRLDEAALERPFVKGSMGQETLNPAHAEARLQRKTVAALLDQLGLPSDGGEWDNLTATQRARKAARARWDAR